MRAAQWRADNPERAKNVVRRWKQHNRDRVYASIHKRLALKAKAGGTAYTSAAKIAARMEFHSSRCYYCGGPHEVIEHRIPLSRGGLHLPANLVPSCLACNTRKFNRTEREYREVLS